MGNRSPKPSEKRKKKANSSTTGATKTSGPVREPIIVKPHSK